VDIRTGVSVKPEELLQAGGFDEVVVAVGAEPISLPMAQAQSLVAFAEDVLQDKVKLGKKVVVVGGGMVGCETADTIARDGRQVIVVEQLGQIAGDVEARTKKLMLQRLEAARVEIMCNTKVEGIEKDKIICSQGGIRGEIGGVDNIILAVGYKPNSAVSQLRSEKIHTIGDCAQPRKAITAVHEGFLLGATI
jgi:pyruvate/2-oxoglutarate dehydrogenase complex dihydrolipoamide dehydrogenase (E3) component